MLKTSLLVGTASLLVGAAHAQDVPQPGAPVGPEAAWGDLDPFWGDLDPFWGDLDPFWGDLDPFWGDLDPFWGDLEGFWGDLEGFQGDNRMAWGDLEGFWGDLEGFWGDLEGFWDPANETDWTHAQVADAQARFRRMAADAEAIFGDAVRARHGASFDDALMAPLLARYGVGRDLGGLDALTARDRARLFLDFYDSLMDHAGRDRVDWWMGAVRWSPALAQDHMARRRAAVGILDSRIDRSAQAGRRVRYRGGYDARHTEGLQHGAAVASLIAAPHDGVGVMGVAPNARLLNFDPFDETATAGWWDIKDGLTALRRRGAHVVNASLGVPGAVLDPNWADVVTAATGGFDDVVIVKAAGNSGVEGADSFWRDPSANDALILVGSVDAAGEISTFSNRPGTACMRSSEGCLAGDRLMDRFLVAPGEMVLVDDGSGTGATVRASGTSFAAPLVTGTVALMHARWPWLERHAAATADIVLETARDLGAPGPDPVYGRGLLDVEAALSPVDFGALYQIKGRGRNRRRVELGDALLSEGGLRGFARRGVLVAFEDAGETVRDFAIPLEARTVNGRSRVAGRRPQDNQSHLFTRLADWTAGARGLAAQTVHHEGRDYALTLERAEDADGRVTGEAVYAFANGSTLTLGQGAGLPTSLLFDRALDAAAGPRLSGMAGVLGLAQGGSYAGGSVPVGTLGTLSFAAMRSDETAPVLGFEDHPLTDRFAADAYVATGAGLSVARSIGAAAVSLGYQRVSESNGVLGSQGTGALSLAGGGVTDAVTAELRLPRLSGIRLGMSATAGRTAPGAQDGLVSVAPGGLVGTAFAARADVSDVFFGGDAASLTLSQPLTATGGRLAVEGLAVVDREAGTLATVVTELAPGGAPLIAEASYAVALPGERGTLRVLGGYDADLGEGQGGVSLSLRF